MSLEKTFAKYCAKGKLHKVKQFLTDHPNFKVNYCVDYIEISGNAILLGKYSPLMAAAKNGHRAVCEYLLQQYSPKDIINYCGGRKKDYSPLDCALHWSKDIDLVNYLFSQGARTHSELNEKEDGWTKKNEKAIGHTASGSAGGVAIAAGGATAGMAIGTMFLPGVGTVLGGAAGLIAGGITGIGVALLTNRIGAGKDTIRDKDAEIAELRRQAATDANAGAEINEELNTTTQQAEENVGKAEQHLSALEKIVEDTKKASDNSSEILKKLEAFSSEKKTAEAQLTMAIALLKEMKTKLSTANKDNSKNAKDLNRAQRILIKIIDKEPLDEKDANYIAYIDQNRVRILEEPSRASENNKAEELKAHGLFAANSSKQRPPQSAGSSILFPNSLSCH